MRQQIVQQQQVHSIASVMFNNERGKFMKKARPAKPWRSGGFTLIEILISISIIAVLTAVGIVSYVSINRNARDAKRLGNIEQLRSALELYRSDKGYYPSTGDGNFTAASGLISVTDMTNYIAAIPSDPKGDTNPYMYKATNLSATTGQYYGYCLAALTEGITTNNCASIPTGYTYGTKNP